MHGADPFLRDIDNCMPEDLGLRKFIQNHCNSEECLYTRNTEAVENSSSKESASHSNSTTSSEFIDLEPERLLVDEDDITMLNSSSSSTSSENMSTSTSDVNSCKPKLETFRSQWADLKREIREKQKLDEKELSEKRKAEAEKREKLAEKQRRREEIKIEKETSDMDLNDIKKINKDN